MAERLMPPWEEITYFNDPVISTVNVAGGGMIVDRNPQRVVLIITINGGTAVQIAPQPFKSSPVGYALTATSPNVIWTEADHATLCTCAWYQIGRAHV